MLNNRIYLLQTWRLQRSFGTSESINKLARIMKLLQLKINIMEWQKDLRIDAKFSKGPFIKLGRYVSFKSV